MNNPKNSWFMWGVSAKQKYRDTGSHRGKTFYGCAAGDGTHVYLAGSYSTGSIHDSTNGTIRNKINTKHFAEDDIEVDLYLDCDDDFFRLCVVGMEINNKTEVEISGLNRCGNQNGWVPHLIFTFEAKSVGIRCCEIDAQCYGKKMDISWT